MSEHEKEAEGNFLSRWSQRKREAKLPDADRVAVQAGLDVKAAPAPAGEDDAEQAFDLSSLPKLEDVTEATDITGFLRKGVPESLKNAALRKSWALDPAIRNYVNPALDYAYDWNTPGGVPGNSELAAGTDIAKMVLQIMGGGSTDEPVAPDTPPAAPLHHNDAPAASGEPAEIAAVQGSAPEHADQPVRLSEPAGSAAQLFDDYAASDTVSAEGGDRSTALEPSAMQQPSRRHGSAKPRG